MSRTFLIDNIEDVVLEVLHTEDEVRASMQVISRTTSSSRTRSWISDPLDRGPCPRCQGLEVEDHVRVFVLVLDIEDDVLDPLSL